MRVCVISAFPPMRDGVGDYSYNLATSLAERHEVSVLATTARPGGSEPFRTGGVTVVPCWSGSDPLYPIKLALRVSELKPDLVHVQHVHLLYGRPTGLPLIPLLLYLRVRRVPVLATLHNVGALRSFDLIPSRLEAKLGKYLFLLSTRLVCELSTKVHVMKSDDAQLLIEEFGVPREKIVVVPSGVPEARAIPTELAKERTGLRGRFVVECFGFASRGKGYEYALEAMLRVSERVPSAVLALVGLYNPAQDKVYGRICREHAGRLRELAGRLGLGERVRFVDVVSREEMPLYISAADVHLFPYESGGGISGALYAVAPYGKPVVVTDVGKFSEVVDGENGLKIPPRDPAALAEAIIRLYEDKELAERLGENLRRSFSGRRWSAIGEAMARVYEEVIWEGASPRPRGARRRPE